MQATKRTVKHTRKCVGVASMQYESGSKSLKHEGHASGRVLCSLLHASNGTALFVHKLKDFKKHPM